MKRLKKMILVFIAFIILFVVIVSLFLRQPKFGSLASESRLERILKSPNYRDGRFQNIHYTPDLTEGASYSKILRDFFFTKWPGKIPKDSIPSAYTDLQNIDATENFIIWFGHSSYLLQLDGKRYLVDPVFGGAASPVAATTRAFLNTDRYSAEQMPVIDVLVLTHDHWDHLDYKTIKKLRTKVGHVVCGLGVGAHLEKWGYDTSLVAEKDWWETVSIDSSVSLTLTPARHFSGRGLKRSKSLWTSYVLQTPTFKIFIGGDSGYDDQFLKIGEKYGPFDLAMLEDGQYNKSWKYIHMMPEEVVQAGMDLKAKKIFPVHNSKFSLAHHTWKEPLQRVSAEAEMRGQPYITPIIGEKVNLNDTTRVNRKWWEEVE